MGGNGKHRWKFSFHHHHAKEPPKEFVCPISGSLMADPVIVPSGQTFDRVSAQVCRNLNFFPNLEDGSVSDFSNLIPNSALKRTIIHWCDNSGTEHPRAPHYTSIEKIVRGLMAERTGVSVTELLNGVADNPPVIFPHAETELRPRVNRFYSNSSDDPERFKSSQGTPLPFTTRPSCYSSLSSSSSEIVEDGTSFQALNLDTNSSISEEEEQLISKLNSPEVIDQEEAVISLRKITRTNDEARISLCTPEILSALRLLISSKYSGVQVNAVASVVNLSLEKSNKVKIVRSGLVSPLIDVLRAGSSESQEHSAGALFSLALEDENKMAIGALNALPHLLHALRSENGRTRHDSALCLYHLSLSQSNRVKLVKLGAVAMLLSMAGLSDFASRALLILCNLAVCAEGRSAMLDGDGVGCLVRMLRKPELESESTRENCVAVLYALSQAGLRFRGLAKEAGAVEVLREVEETGSERAREKAKRILEMMKGGKYGDDEEDDFGGRNNSVFDTGGLTWTRPRVGVGRNPHTANSSNF